MAGVIELVKNAYDADSPDVEITFINSISPSGSIIITDHGHGMSDSSIMEGWMSPATSWKGARERSPNKERPMLGRKGVGRFAAMRLGNRLSIDTRPEGKGLIHKLSLQWSDFLAEGLYLDEVLIDLRTENAETTIPGTRLIISDLHDVWDFSRLRRLVRELRLLLSPVAVREDDPFDIRLDLHRSGLEASELKGLPEAIEPYEVPEVADYSVLATVDETGRCEVVYERRLLADVDQTDLSISQVFDDIRVRYGDVNGEQTNAPVDSTQLFACGPLFISLQLWDRDQELLQEKLSLPQFEGLSIRGIRQFLNDASGVGIYRDGFRVRPYGDPAYDWLELAARRVQNPSLRIGTNQVSGRIDISMLTNPQLEDRTSREGLEENAAYNELKRIVVAVLSTVEPLRFQFRQRNNLGRRVTRTTQALAEERRSAFLNLREHVTRLISDGNTRRTVLDVISNAEAASEAEHERLAHQVEALHDTHALGTLARFVIHEGRNVNSALNAAIDNIRRIAIRSLQPTGEVRIAGKDKRHFSESVEAASGAEARLSDLLDDLDPLMRRRRSRRKRFVVEEILSAVISILRPTVNRAGIELSTSAGTHQVLAWDADLLYALYNLLDNAVYWVQKGPHPRRIGVVVAEADDANKLTITVSDSGPGVSEAIAENIFDLGFSDRDGYGLGLFLARESIQRSYGTLELLNAGEPGAVFRITLARPEENE